MSVAPLVDLGPNRYQSTLNAFRMFLDTPGSEFFDIAVRTPKGEIVLLQIRRQDAYVVAFRGAQQWWSFVGEIGARGAACGIGANYNDFGFVGTVTYDDLNALGQIGHFVRGAPLNKRLFAILVAVTSEAARFATVATFFVGLTNSVGTEHSPYLQGAVDFEYLKQTYFRQWQKPPRIEMRPGSVYHFVRPEGEILFPHKIVD